MKLLKTIRSPVAGRAGLALVTTIIVLAVIGMIVAAMATAAMSSARAAAMEYHEGRAFFAAEAGGEAALAQLKLALQDGFLADDELTDMTPPVLEPFSFDSFAAGKVGAAVVETITDGPYEGLYALTQNVEIVSLVTDPGGTTSGVILDAKAQAIPIFQFGVFFDQDLEATNGPPMDFVGRVHSNGNIYLSSNNAWYMDMITTPNKVFHDRKDFHRVYDGVFIYNPVTKDSVPLDFDSRTIPGAEAFKAQSELQFAGRLRTDAFDVDSLSLPLPDGVPPYELIRPREDDDGAAERSVKFAWNADTYLIVDLGHMQNRYGVCGGDDDDDDDEDEGWVGAVKWWPDITVIRDGKIVPSKAALCEIVTWEWSAFYDGREEQLKDVLTIDIKKLDDWVGNDEDRLAEIVYVEFRLPATIDGYPDEVLDILLDATVDPAMRLKEGEELPNRLTFATDWPLYVEGNYNKAHKQPAALASDGLTILSRKWKDKDNRPDEDIFDNCDGLVSQGNPCPGFENWVNTGVWSYERAGETWVNAGVIAGHWPTPCDHHDAGCPADGTDSFYQDWYGGGIENFPRFLENWRESDGDKVVFHYSGALISPFTSQKTDGTWNGSYYRPPQRDWSFDTDFRDPELLPPGTPNVGSVIRTAMREAF
ncbi:MAG: hypothetical protein PVJ64_14380 [Gemmatimonadales bacterium]|jgi:hypothetical protein